MQASSLPPPPHTNATTPLVLPSLLRTTLQRRCRRDPWFMTMLAHASQGSKAQGTLGSSLSGRSTTW